MRWLALVSLVCAYAATACSSDPPAGDAPARVVVSAYPLEFLAEGVGGDAIVVTNLTPPGTEPHDVEATTEDLDRIEDADLVLYLGGGFQPAIERAAESRGDHAVDVLAEIGDEDGDPHFWLDPVLMKRAAQRVETALREVAAVDEGSLSALVRSIDAVHAEYEQGLAFCERRVIVTAHDAFGRLADRYALVSRSIAGLDPESEPDAGRLAELSDFVRREGVTTVFSETLASPRVAETLAREAGVTTAVLDPIEGGDVDWIGAMRSNLAVLKAALACP